MHSICWRGRTSAKKWVLLVASTLFYLWGEPVFVLILVASTAIDYALSFHLNDPTPRSVRGGSRLRPASSTTSAFSSSTNTPTSSPTISIGRLRPSALIGLPLLHLALPIGVSFVVFEKITYLVDTYRGISKPAATFSDYCLFVLFFPKLARRPDPQISRNEGPDRQAACGGMERFPDSASCGLRAASDASF